MDILSIIFKDLGGSLSTKMSSKHRNSKSEK